jgi:hypothetical protein
MPKDVQTLCYICGWPTGKVSETVNSRVAHTPKPMRVISSAEVGARLEEG